MFALLLAALFLFFITYFKVDSVKVKGNTRYTNEQIEDLVMTGPLGDNSVWLYLKYHDRPVTDIPFIEKMDVNIVSPTAVEINVYEKAIAGYVKYLGGFMYFDRDGIIVESSAAPIDKVPCVTGLEFDECVKYEPLPVKDKSVFSDILSLAQLFEKYGIQADRIYFAPNRDITLYFGDARVMVGSMDNIDEKMMELKEIVPRLEGLKGVLHLEDYKGDETLITFEKE
ncbi:MAG: FtsQ-type POTRA domain-containing protein [Lachnospiraceae bacterium]|nr:FtsQ-type POTRA domain-containing protein [Lachnospiraceae bacterium]